MPGYTAFPYCCSASIFHNFPSGSEKDLIENTKNTVATQALDAFLSGRKCFVTLNKVKQHWCYQLLIGMGWEELDCWPSSHKDGTKVVLLTN